MLLRLDPLSPLTVVFCTGIKRLQIELLRYRKSTPYWQNSNVNFHIKKMESEGAVERLSGGVWPTPSFLLMENMERLEKTSKIVELKILCLQRAYLAHIPPKILVFIMTRKKTVGNSFRNYKGNIKTALRSGRQNFSLEKSVKILKNWRGSCYEFTRLLHRSGLSRSPSLENQRNQWQNKSVTHRL